MNKLDSLIIGAGEVGNGLHKVIGGDIMDNVLNTINTYDIIHICFPYGKKFEKYVKEYQKIFNPKYTVIHSTVPMGTSKRLNACHSPIRGVHPFMDKGIKTFVKFVGGKNAEQVGQFFKSKGLKVRILKDSNTTEALKLWDTTQYGAMILLNKEIYKWCKENKVDFDIIYTEGNTTYNEGYKKLGRPEVVRPHLKYTEGKIGGHCVYQNTKLFKSETTKRICNFQIRQT